MLREVTATINGRETQTKNRSEKEYPVFEVNAQQSNRHSTTTITKLFKILLRMNPKLRNAWQEII